MKSVTYQIPIPWEKEQPCLHRLIRQIQTRPGMYIGSNALTPLSHFLNGYRAAERDLGVCWHGILFPLDFQFMHSFTDARLHTECVCAGWCRNMLTFCHGDEEKALNLFFALYQEFIEVEMKRYWRTILTKENIARNNKMEHYCLVQSSQGRAAPEPPGICCRSNTSQTLPSHGRPPRIPCAAAPSWDCSPYHFRSNTIPASPC